jgi:hypothetical protein
MKRGTGKRSLVKRPPVASTPDRVPFSKYLDSHYEPRLDLLCEMAWRVAGTDKTFATLVATAASSWPPKELMERLTEKWSAAVHIAHKLICTAEEDDERHAFVTRTLWRHETMKRGEIIVMTQRLPISEDEREKGRVTFVRGCQLILGIKDESWAKQKFDRLMPILAPLTPNAKGIEEYQRSGFDIESVALLARSYRDLPKRLRRKPTEKTGDHRRNKQGRKKIEK